MKALHEKNLIVPVSGDFGGPKALRAIGAYLKAQGGTVSAFYVSNVEQYLFQDSKAAAFYENVATLPVLPTQRVHPALLDAPRRRRFGEGLCRIARFLAPSPTAASSPTTTRSPACHRRQRESKTTANPAR